MKPAKPAARYQHSRIQWLQSPILWLSIAAVGLLSALLWLLLTFGPVVAVEAKYQYRRLFSTVFTGDGSLRSLFIPNISVDIRGFNATNTENGIVIPAIYLDEPVIYNVNPNDSESYLAALRQGIAHASSTAFPDTGGIGYYFAHSSAPEFRSQFNAVFYLLGKLEPGDEIFIWHQGERFEYQVTQSVEVDPEDTYFLQQEYATETIVLQTCWPPGTTLQRKLVFAERVYQ
ncbi:sortase [Candidatus Woesebacteria bacterium]|nr:sortase [Candidatus Woesebacteria bacterium]MCD8507570.1 sortase [Candidatus Woesebacteria bacterium]MCD8527410.1 sortase [Candidatus Woesebacteria bacterium]MCD8546157.1 sortase [Candidatus Woesebacteria bacterium]